MPHACASAAAATAGRAGLGRGRGVARQAGGGVRVVWGRERERFYHTSITEVYFLFDGALSLFNSRDPVSAQTLYPVSALKCLST
jgi:hypothetical protein